MTRFAASILALLAVAFPASARQRTLVVRAEGFHSGLPLDGARVQLFLAGNLQDEAVTGADGIVAFTVSGVGTESIPASEFHVGEPWPNPAIGAARVPVRLDRGGPIEATLFDILGRRVAARSDVREAGPHDLTVEAQGIARGLYVVRFARPGSFLVTTSILFSGSGGGSQVASLSWSPAATRSSAESLDSPLIASKTAGPGEYEVRVSRPGHLDHTEVVDIRLATETTVRLSPGYVNATGTTLLEVPPGVFLMGSSFRTTNEYPEHPVAITRAFWLGRFELTNDEYFLTTGRNSKTSALGGRAAAGISWQEAVRALNAMSVRDGLAPCYLSQGEPVMDPLDCPGYRFPTEAEWEYAARAGTSTEYFFGDSAIDLSLFAQALRGSPRVKPVGLLLPNPWRFHDIVGNVREWVGDWYDPAYYIREEWVDPVGPPTGTYRSLRGGEISGPYSQNEGRSAYRDGLAPTSLTDSYGLRVARTIPAAPRANRPPSAPVPDGASVEIRAGAHLAWSASDPDGDALTYSLVIYTGDGRLVAENDLRQPRWPTWSLQADRTYSGRVLAHDGRILTAGPRWSFSVTGRVRGAFESYTTPSGIDMIRIPAGTFRMGADSGLPHHRPAHDVTLTRDFWMSVFEIRAEVLRRFVESAVTYTLTDFRLPAYSVRWQEAIAFANALSKAEGYVPCYGADGTPIGNPYACHGYRLPTEAEWEYAARAGTTGPYSFGNDASQIDFYAWSLPASGGRAHPTGVLGPNPWGLHDMHGNLWEFVADWYDPNYYSVSPAVNPRGPATGSDHVGRGGGGEVTPAYQVSYFRRAMNSCALRIVRTAF